MSSSSSSSLQFQHIGLSGITTGTIKFDSSFIEWRTSSNSPSKKFEYELIEKAEWIIYGLKGHLFLSLKDGKTINLDGFNKSDYNTIAEWFQTHYNIEIEQLQVASDGGNFGDIDLDGNSLILKSALSSNRIFELKLNNVSQCVLPGNNKDELEIQFHESDTIDKEEDMLVQVRLRFPSLPEKDDEKDDEEDGDGEGDGETRMTLAEKFQKNIMERGMIRSITGNVIAEFTQDQGTFVTPRGRYAIQMYSTFMRMHGAKYDYKISYEDITCLYLLFRPDGVSAAIVISLEKPIRQGNQKYPHLVLQTNRVEYTMEVNLTDEELATKYEGQLQREMTMPMCSLIAKIFKVLSQSKVYVSNVYKSERGDQCVKCSYKTNDGLLYPLQKLLLFIHKPTVVLKYEDVESVEILRYAANAMSASKNFDILFKLKPNAVQGGEKDILFSGIDRSEFGLLHAFLSTKKMQIKADEGAKGESILDQIGQEIEGDDDEEEESEDEDYEAQSSSSSSEDEESAAEEENTPAPSPKKKNRSREAETSNESKPEKKAKVTPTEKVEKKSSESKPKSTTPSAPNDKETKKRKADTIVKSEPSEETEGKGSKKGKKDPALPKGPRSAYTYFTEEYHSTQKGNAASFGELSKLAGEKWRTLSATEKEKYDKLAQSDKERYNREMADYTPSSGFGSDGKALASSSSSTTATTATTSSSSKSKGSSSTGKGKKGDANGDEKKKKVKDKNAPKAALTAYNIFCSKIRAKIKEEIPGISPTDIVKEAAARWKTISAEEKSQYDQLAQADKVRHSNEMNAYKSKNTTTNTTTTDDVEEDNNEEGGDEDDNDNEDEGSDGDN
mmetsp:Transcript_12210/g.12596  ORF Transcript_12210/g.12596 Transcript_12210/m.12596 type:complete len:841 (-) Transcript_12210:18-2540(-)|eukprot:CAMPEP_0174822120 /NCGR_PEP_ID=MMETSP1107-20130205/13561_1 /TAXON_ID=36770 /ORGANISM="Paraphysomonas vestita, Strain GFlagA" /LENGTH=840 /DNA_ID=CAMNT_0016040193 /DNA_START=1 /DNA_END=2523 /DNA_ORIENTATION=-